MENQTVKDRLMLFIKEMGYKVSVFEREAKLSVGYLRQLRKEPSREKIKSIIYAFPFLNEEWLLTGEGEMLRDGTIEKENSATMVKDFKLVPLINIDSVGGMMHGNALTTSEQYRERMIPFTEAREGDVAIYQSGDSMNPGIPPGSILLIRNVPDWQEYFGYGDVFVLWLRDDRRLTKQVRKFTPDPANFVTCHSFNPEYGDEELPKKYIREVWKVIKVLADKGW